jgi:hypothetical protein
MWPDIGYPSAQRREALIKASFAHCGHISGSYTILVKKAVDGLIKGEPFFLRSRVGIGVICPLLPEVHHRSDDWCNDTREAKGKASK